MKISFFVVVVASFVQLSRQESCHWRELDLCSITALSSMQNPPIPKSEEDMDKQCTTFRENVACVSNYTNKCLTPLQREILALANEQTEANYKEFCTAGSEIRKNILKHAACLSDAWNEQSSCVNDAQAAVETFTDAEASKRVIIACCTYQRFRQCAVDIMKSKCGDETVEFVNQLITLYASDIPNVVCTNYDAKDSKCMDALPAPGTLPKGTAYNDLISRFISTYIGN